MLFLFFTSRTSNRGHQKQK